MEYRYLGGSDLKSSCLGLGGNIFGYFCNPQETSQILAKAKDLGINFVDTADVYGKGLSEEYIGQAIKDCRDHWILATKVGVPSGDYPGGIGKKQTIIERIEASLKRLKTDYIDLYQMHYFDPETPLEETLETLNLLIQQGKIRYFGASNYSGEKLTQASQIAKINGWRSFCSSQNNYNLFKRNLEKNLFPVCQSLQVGAIIYGAMARGILSGKYRLGQSLPENSRASVSASINADLTENVLEIVEQLISFSLSQGKTIGDLALAWILQKYEVSTVLVGTRNVEQLQANVNGIDWKLSPSDLVKIDEIMGDLNQFNSQCFGEFPTWL